MSSIDSFVKLFFPLGTFWQKRSLDIISQCFGYLKKYQPRPHFQPESFSSKSDNGCGLILRVITKTQSDNLFITYSNSLF